MSTFVTNFCAKVRLLTVIGNGYNLVIEKRHKGEKKMKQSVSLKTRVQKVGSTLSSMIMPNIGALIAWGVLTALFIPDGYLPNEKFASIGGPMLTYLIPILIAYTGGKVIGGERGAVVGAIGTIGVIAGTNITMMLGAMVMGPLGGYVIKIFDKYVQNRVKAGFEMLVNNFSVGLIGFGLALIGYIAVGPFVTTLTQLMANGVEIILNANLLPLTNIFIEPAKILFLNNAINHGILTPLGTEQVAEAGKSILFLLEANPGPGLGVLLAFTLYGKGAAKASAPGAMIIHFLGGIHEIYFPYVMMKPMLFLSVIAGGVSGSFVFQTLDAGLRAPASPGSIIAILAMTAAGSYVPVILGILVATVVSFFISAVILKADSKSPVTDEFEEKVRQSKENKAMAKGQSLDSVSGVISNATIQHIVFACDAGMGSSAMGASILRKKVNAAGLLQDVTNSAISNLKDDKHTLIVTQVELQERARQKAPNSTFVAVENFLNSPKYEDIISKLTQEEAVEEKVVTNGSVDLVLDGDVKDIEEVLFVHDEREGSATMGISIFKEMLARQGLDIPVRKVSIEELNPSKHSLVIASDSLSEDVLKQSPKGVHLSVKNLVQTQKYEKIVALLKKVA